MLDKEKIVKIINEIDSLFIEDTRYPIFWNQLTQLLSEDEQETIDFLDSCNDENIINNISSIFDNISSNLQSNKFIKCLKRLEIKFPNLLLYPMIEAAVYSMET
ncbi:hypothetical protein [Chamaesiphon minutus]|uniref:Immunity protein 30 domain-containing protein n=1 Tax=Chamaesiphon minutus (strain ATCC 27169 / PCC 6605) TaxID=1173020 RepID=K9UF64_CHAP6|nr:hypothetical protein [Chamaesiphon minutus]AFY93470.1 hypothetical protein Cha6605_2411 [Chamaesiphon minutus PCC 6605]